MSEFNLKQATVISPIGESISHLLPYEQKQRVEEVFIPKIKAASEKVESVTSEYQSAKEDFDIMVARKEADLLALPSERHGFTIKQVYPTNQQRIIREMNEQGFMVHQIMSGFIAFTPIPKNAKDDVMKPIMDAIKSEATSSVNSQLSRREHKVKDAIHQRNLIVKEAREALASIQSFEDYLNISITDEAE
ncbi:hypothetical protein AU509_03000 [Lonsdalea britannica]|uniref:Uncharacterized protein n=1 Tax=Lonsdalea britannica TaxID=1082704 RepID=A0AAD0SGB1_9GAMM|nr:hypothetical protein [Lonsdalea britannica]AXW87272.1 hypothetical protein CKQ53_09940 [Lonsdalea britannica]OSM99792.1 hypothetical protein AU509_03000 [Lonsdalea britannica]